MNERNDDDEDNPNIHYAETVKEICEKRIVSEAFASSLLEYVKHIGGDRKSLSRVVCDAVRYALEAKKNDVLGKKENDSSVSTTLSVAAASLDRLQKQQEQVQIVDETSLAGLFACVCSEILTDYYDVARERQTQEQSNMRRKLNPEDTVNLFDESLMKGHHEDKTEVVSSFCAHLNKQMKQWNSKYQSYEYEEGYSVLFQSSGMGKTHLIFKTMQSKVFGVYLCFRGSSDTDTYPPRSPVMDWLIQPKTRRGVELSATNEEVADLATERFLDVMQATQQLFKEWSEQNENGTPEDWFDYQKGSKKTDFVDFQIKLLDRAKQIPFDQSDGFDKAFVFFIDEGKTLVEKGIFRAVRLCFGRRSPFFRGAVKPFALFTDIHTLPPLPKPAPAMTVTASTRFVPHIPGMLFPPFYFVKWIDVFVDNESSGSAKESPMSLSKYGRPLWKAYEVFLKAKKKPAPDQLLLQFAKSKLLGSTKLLENIAGDHRKAAAVACLACRAPLCIPPGRRIIATELVASHMAVCLHVQEDRNSFLIGYPSEPLLSMASSHVLRGDDNKFSGWKVALEELQGAIQDAEVDISKIGEMMHQLVFLLAIDSACAANGDKLPSAYDFLREIVGDSIDSETDEGTKNALKAKFVSFNHFLQVYYVPNASRFQAIANRRAAIVCKPGQNGISHEIPLIDKENGNVVGTIAIQTKNVPSKHDSDYPASAGWKMSREFALHESDRGGSKNDGDFYFALYHNIGYQKPNGNKSFECKSMEAESGYHNWQSEQTQCKTPKGLEIMGLDLPLFSTSSKIMGEIKRTLEVIRDQGRNPIAHLLDETLETEQLVPLAYNAFLDEAD